MRQNWIKLSFIFKPENFGLLFAAVPIALINTEGNIRVIFSSRNEKNQSIPYWVDLDMISLKVIDKPHRINIYLGELGAFDDSGIMPSCLVKCEDELWMYYIGWNLGVTVPFRNSIGLAVSKNNGKSFEKKFIGPILDRTKDEPHFVASNCVLFEEGIYKMWYLSCVKWDEIDGKITHFYHIKYATSRNGIDWDRKGVVAIDLNYKNEYAISVPRVIKENKIYKMWYSFRGNDEITTYRIGYAESNDGINWIRKDNEVGIDISESGWDSEMVCYPYIFDYNGDRYMLYNGNGYGKTGFGLAKFEK